MMTLSTVGQWWVAKSTDYRIPGGVTTTLYPVEYEEAYSVFPLNSFTGNLSNALSYREPSPELYTTGLLQNFSGNLSTILLFYDRNPAEAYSISVMTVFNGTLNSILLFLTAPEEAYSISLATVFSGQLNTILLTYSTGLPEEYTVSVLPDFWGVLNEI